MRAGLWRRQSTKELMLSNCGAGEDSWDSLGQQGDQPVHPKGNQSWIIIGRTVAEAEAPVLWSPDVSSWLVGKDPDAGKDWRQKENGMSENEMAGWHYWCNGHELGQTLEDGEGQRGLACCSSWSHKELAITGWLNNCNNNTIKVMWLISLSFSSLKIPCCINLMPFPS